MLDAGPAGRIDVLLSTKRAGGARENPQKADLAISEFLAGDKDWVIAAFFRVLKQVGAWPSPTS